MIIPIHDEHPEPRKIARVVELLRQGEIIAYPTDTVYGLGCDLMNKKAIDKLYAIKRMNRNLPLAFVCPDLSDIAKYAIVEKAQYRVLKHFLPGPYCFILEATREVPRLVQMKQKTVGIRVPNHPVIREIVRELGNPVISTSAQVEGAEHAEVDPREIRDLFPGLAIILDAGGGGTNPTTIVDLTLSPPKVIREGAGSVEEFIVAS